MRLLLTAVLMMSAVGLLAQEQAAEGASPMTNLVSFFDKCRAGGPVTVAYIGGSITAQNGWRPFTTAWLKKKFKDCEIREVNAAIGGTGSYLGVFRLEKHVLQFDPDLVFVEFAVNDNGAQDEAVMSTMEGIVRQCWMREKKPAIVFTYTTAHTLQVPTHRHQAVADYYGIPTVDFQRSIRAVVDPGFIDWDILAEDKVHPGDWGHAIYAATLATFLKKQMALTEAVDPPAELPAPKVTDFYATARLIPVVPAAGEGWKINEPGGNFKDGSILATEPGTSIEIKFTGTMVAIYYELRMNGGIISCEIDGKPVGEKDVSCGPIYRFNRQNSISLGTGLEPGEHTLKITVTDKRHELSEGHEFHLGYLMVAG